ncbi:hypothetical protein RRG08_016947 [Elysia crispata]|uniref:Secreted protein n=1 Tax=Elysia crispata TaxID=231223 RepID=A0AAE1A688_9GAST|nr:hypothetical protein RRG08_016947 [Elysia crispata]
MGGFLSVAFLVVESYLHTEAVQITGSLHLRLGQENWGSSSPPCTRRTGDHPLLPALGELGINLSSPNCSSALTLIPSETLHSIILVHWRHA